jgi:DnaJ-class molecular chaperone
MPRFGTSGHGDLLVDIDLRLGQKLSAKQKKQLEDLGF